MQTQNLKKTPESEVIKKTIEVLKSGGLVICPTETVYIMAADATNQTSIDKLIQYKARREGKPLSIAVSDKKMAEQYVDINSTAEKLYKNFLPGPVTVVSKSKHKVVKGVESELGTLGIRIPDYPLVLKIVKSFKKPITATSANASYKKRPYRVRDIFDNISEKQKKLIDLVLDAGELPIREPSTVIDTTFDDIKVLRQGDIKLTNKQTKKTTSAEETSLLGGELMKKYKHYLGFKSVVFCLEGELGAGKTQLTKGIAKELGVKERITSPTYILENEYSFNYGKNKYKLIHSDAWRIVSDAEFLDLGFEKEVDDCSVIVIEWADRIVSALEPFGDEAKMLWVHIDYGTSETERRIIISDFSNKRP